MNIYQNKIRSQTASLTAALAKLSMAGTLAGGSILSANAAALVALGLIGSLLLIALMFYGIIINPMNYDTPHGMPDVPAETRSPTPPDPGAPPEDGASTNPPN